MMTRSYRQRFLALALASTCFACAAPQVDLEAWRATCPVDGTMEAPTRALLEEL